MVICTILDAGVILRRENILSCIVATGVLASVFSMHEAQVLINLYPFVPGRWKSQPSTYMKDKHLMLIYRTAQRVVLEMGTGNSCTGYIMNNNQYWQRHRLLRDCLTTWHHAPN